MKNTTRGSISTVDHSTVVVYPPTTPKDNNQKRYSLRISVELKSANLWVAPYSAYQQELFDIITKFHEKDGWNFPQISDWLGVNGYSTPRGRSFSQKHVWSIYQKKNRSIRRFSREFEDTLKDVRIDVVDYMPTPIE